MKKLSVIISVILCCALCFTLCSCSASGENDVYTDTLYFSDFDELDIDMVAEHINLYVVDGCENHIYYTASVSGFMTSKPQMTVDEHDSTVEIGCKYGFMSFGSSDVDADIYINKSTFKKLSIDMINGTLNISDKLDVVDLSVDMTSGDTGISNITANECEIDLTSGEVRVKGEITKCEANVTSGLADVISTVFPRELSSDLTSGTIRFTIPESKDGFTLDYDITSGSLESDFDLGGNISKAGTVKYADGKSDFDFDIISGKLYLKKAD